MSEICSDPPPPPPPDRVKLLFVPPPLLWLQLQTTSKLFVPPLPFSMAKTFSAPPPPFFVGVKLHLPPTHPLKLVMEKSWNMKSWPRVMDSFYQSWNFTNFAPELYQICIFFAFNIHL